jgi:voltage-gated potassium channel
VRTRYTPARRTSDIIAVVSIREILLWPAQLIFRGLIRIANSAKATVLWFLGMIVTSAVLYSLCENKGVGDSVWWAVVTASTVGYGDTYPTTPFGRIVAGTLISAMVLLVIPLITAHFASKLIVDQDAFRHEEQEEIKENLRRIRELVERMEAAAATSGAGVTVPGSSDRQPAPSGRSDTS